MLPLRAAIVGAGWIANDHVSVLRRLGEVEIVAVCDLDAERAERLAPPGARTYRDWGDLLEREELDAVWICTPPLHHRPPAVAALERGLNVYLEKPIARTLDDAAAIVEAASRAWTICAVGYQWHATEALDALRDAIDGQEVALLVGRSLGPTNARPWFLDRAQGGGNILERGSHQIDLLRAVAGDVVSVQAAASQVVLAQGEEERGDIEDAAALVLRFASGAIGTILVAWTRAGLPGLYTLDVLASDAALYLTLDPEFTLRGTSRGRAVSAETRQHPFERSLARFVEAVRTRDPASVFCTPADAARTLAVAQACEQALGSGETVAVPAPAS